MKEVRRINLSFDLNDPDQKKAYEFLSRSSGEKSSKVTEAILRTFLSDTYWKNTVVEREVSLTEHFVLIGKEQKQEIVDEVSGMMNDFLGKMNKMQNEWMTILQNSPELIAGMIGGSDHASSDTEQVKVDNEPKVDEVDDAAFEGLMSMFG